MRKVLPLIFMLLVLLPAGSAAAADVRLEQVGRFSQPVYVTSPPGYRRTLVVVERYGRIRRVVRGHVKRRPLADLRSRVKIDDPNETVDQRGLFSVAFPRDYRRSGRFYVQYVDRAGKERVDELRRGRRSVRRVLDLGAVGTQHHGGQLQFGPDGLLYVSTGKDTPVHPGSLLRLDPRRSAPPEVYATGLRNPWRFSFDRGTGALLIGDVGDQAAEEIDVLAPGAPAGANFGWPAFEGDRRREPGDPPGYVEPALVLKHADRWCAITGGYVARDRRPARHARGALRVRRPLLGPHVERRARGHRADRRAPARPHRALSGLVRPGRARSPVRRRLRWPGVPVDRVRAMKESPRRMTARIALAGLTAFVLVAPATASAATARDRAGDAKPQGARHHPRRGARLDRRRVRAGATRRQRGEGARPRRKGDGQARRRGHLHPRPQQPRRGPPQRAGRQADRHPLPPHAHLHPRSPRRHEGQAGRGPHLGRRPREREAGGDAAGRCAARARRS